MSFCKKEGQKPPPVSGNFQFRSGEKETAAPKNDTAERDRKWNQYTRREREWGKAIWMRKNTAPVMGWNAGKKLPRQQKSGTAKREDRIIF